MNDLTDGFNGDLAVIEALKSRGSDLTKEHLCDFFFYGNESALEALKNKLLQSGFSVSPGKVSVGALSMTKRFKPTAEIMNEVRYQLLAICAPLEIDYDGWGALIEK